LRKHGIRFGQYTIFMPALLKPAPTRLRLVLWSLANGADEFPESPPPGLVTIPHLPAIPSEIYLISGYRPAGDRAIRIDMLERLADMLRSEDSRTGFEAKPDMLSITGMTLEQFANLMEGLGYKAERGEREKPLPADKVLQGDARGSARDATSDSAVEETSDKVAEEGTAPATEIARTSEVEADAPATGEAVNPAVEDEDRTEVFFTFAWGGNRGGQKRGGQRPQGKREGGKPRGKGKPHHSGGDKNKPRTFEARPERKKDRIDPDNPFAKALMGLKTTDK